ncbi:MAG TPA: nucleotidyltransferase [Bryobacteraceae bacterium]|nr:nucleotidyltransferase [Bryobacteraceae bacterium]
MKLVDPKPPQIVLPDLIPPEQWAVYERVMRCANQRGIHYAIGGAVAMGAYTERWRNTKDVDLYVVPVDRERMVEVFRDCGLADFHDRMPYDRRWIYRGYDEPSGSIVDVIWAMANMRTEVDQRWLTHGKQFITGDMIFRVLPPEELIWSKLYVIQRERCDWPDVLNILYATASCLQWNELLARLGDDAPLLKAVLSIFAWMCPEAAESIPEAIRLQFDLTPEDAAPNRVVDTRRVRLLDGRPWFGPNVADARAA